MKLTIGMAHFDDFDGAIFSLQSLALHHALGDGEIELLVVDNSPATAQGKALAQHCTAARKRGAATLRYVPMPENGGTTQTRERIFAEATGDAVLVMDCHVLIAPGAIERLAQFYADGRDDGALLQGPLLYNDLTSISTHFADEWRAEMWGTWATDPRGLDPDGEPFEIPGQGLGLFSCRRESWLGFNPHFRGFGGEEMYIHEKFRQAGRRCLCLPWLRWWHRFERPGGVRYPLTRWNKVRNYVLGHQELGLPLDRVEQHFVATGLMPRTEWEKLIADPVKLSAEPKAGCPTKTCGGEPNRAQPPESAGSLDALFDWVTATPRDLDQHAATIREFTAQCSRVTAFVKRREWNAILAAARPKSLTVYQLEQDPLLDRVHAAVQADVTSQADRRTYTTHVGPEADSLAAAAIERTEMLVIDTVHHADRLTAELERHGGLVDRFIVLRGTAIAGETSEDKSGPGLLPAMRRWMKAHPEWSVVHHSQDQYGLTVLSRDKRDKPKLPSAVRMAANLAKAVATHVADGMHQASAEELEARLEVCSLCPHRTDDRCSVCGCFVAPKAAMRSSVCPLGMWPAAANSLQPADAAASEGERDGESIGS